MNRMKKINKLIWVAGLIVLTFTGCTHNFEEIKPATHINLFIFFIRFIDLKVRN